MAAIDFIDIENRLIETAFTVDGLSPEELARLLNEAVVTIRDLLREINELPDLLHDRGMSP